MQRTIEDYELPYKCGDVAGLHSLRAEEYNGQQVTISYFHRARLRYAVLLSNGKQILVKAQNLRPADRLLSSYEEFTSLYQRLGESNLQVRDLEDIWERMEIVCDDNQYLALGMESILSYLIRVTDDTSILAKFYTKAHTIAELVEDPRTRIRLLLQIAEIARHENVDDKTQELLRPYLERHYGRLMAICTKFDLSTILKYLPKIKFLLQHGIYCYDELHVHTFFMCLLDMTKSKPEHLSDVNGMIVFLKDVPRGKSVLNARIKKLREEAEIHIEALLAMSEGRYEEAISKLTLILQNCTLTYGRNHSGSYSILVDILVCYIKFGDKKRAKKTLKRLKKMDKNCDTKIMETLISKMSDSGKRSKTEVKSTLCKCSNPYCTKVEKKRGEFGLCANCEAVKYCSRKCQIKHFKNGHRNQCGK